MAGGVVPTTATIFLVALALATVVLMEDAGEAAALHVLFTRPEEVQYVGGAVTLAPAECGGSFIKMGPDGEPEAFQDTFEQVAGIYQWTKISGPLSYPL